VPRDTASPTLCLPSTGGEDWGGRRGPKVPTRAPPLEPAPTQTPVPFSPSLEGGEGGASTLRAGPRNNTPGPHALIRETARRKSRAVTFRPISDTPKRISTGTEEPGILIPSFFRFGSGRGSGGELERLSRGAASPPEATFTGPSPRPARPPAAAAQGDGRGRPDDAAVGVVRTMPRPRRRTGSSQGEGAWPWPPHPAYPLVRCDTSHTMVPATGLSPPRPVSLGTP